MRRPVTGVAGIGLPDARLDVPIFSWPHPTSLGKDGLPGAWNIMIIRHPYINIHQYDIQSTHQRSIQFRSSGVKELLVAEKHASNFPWGSNYFSFVWVHEQFLDKKQIYHLAKDLSMADCQGHKLKLYTTASDPRFQPTTRASAWKRVVRSTWSSAWSHHSSPQVVLRPLIMALLYCAGTTGMVGQSPTLGQGQLSTLVVTRSWLVALVPWVPVKCDMIQQKFLSCACLVGRSLDFYAIFIQIQGCAATRRLTQRMPCALSWVFSWHLLGGSKGSVDGWGHKTLQTCLDCCWTTGDHRGTPKVSLIGGVQLRKFRGGN